MPCAAHSGADKGAHRSSSRRVFLACSPRAMFEADRSSAAHRRWARAPWRSASFMRPSRRRRRRMSLHLRSEVLMAVTIVALGGSLGRQSTSLAAVRVALEGAAGAGAATELFDVRELDLPMFVPDETDVPQAARRF